MTQEKSPNISGKVIAAASAILAIPSAIAITGVVQNETTGHVDKESSTATLADREAYKGSIEAAINAHYDTEALVGEVSVKEGGSLGNESLNLVQSALGEDLYNDIKGRIYDPLMDSAKQYIPQPDEKFSVVSVDLNPEANDGDEYVVVRPDHIVYDASAGLPTVETE